MNGFRKKDGDLSKPVPKPTDNKPGQPQPQQPKPTPKPVSLPKTGTKK